MLRPKQLLESRDILKADKTILQYLIHWEGLPSVEATWVNADEVHVGDSLVSFEDKAIFPTGGKTDTNPKLEENWADASD